MYTGLFCMCNSLHRVLRAYSKVCCALESFMGWLRRVSSLTLYVSFAEYGLF